MPLFGEKARRGLTALSAKVGLEHTKEITNTIAEEKDVVDSYRAIVKQVAEASHYLEKWAGIAEDPTLVAMFAQVQASADPVSASYNAFLSVFEGDYLSALKNIQASADTLAKQHDKVVTLEGKVAKGKATQAELDLAQKQFQDDSQRYKHETNQKYSVAVKAVTQAYIKLHEGLAAQYRKQLAALEGINVNTTAHVAAPAPVAAAVTPVTPVTPAAPIEEQPDDDEDDIPPPAYE